MTLQEIADRLHAEFPDKAVKFGITVWNHGDLEDSVTGKRPVQTFEMDMWCAQISTRLQGNSLEDLIHRMHAAIISVEKVGTPAPQLDVEVTVPLAEATVVA